MENQSFFEKPLGELMSILENDGKKIASRVEGNCSTDLYLYNEDLLELHFKDQVPVRLHQMVDEAADEYLSNTFNMEAWEEGDYRVALRCPFTGKTRSIFIYGFVFIAKGYGWLNPFLPRMSILPCPNPRFTRREAIRRPFCEIPCNGTMAT